MSRRNRGKVGATVRPVQVPRVLLRSQVSGEMVSHFGGSPEEVLAAQTGVLKGWIEAVVVYGLDGSGIARDEIALTFGADNDGDIEIDLADGKSAINGLCGSLARAVSHAADRMRRRGLVPEFRYRLRDEIQNDPDRLAAVRRELGTEGADEPSWGDGMAARSILSIRPGKDPNMTLSMRRGFRKL